MSENSIHTSVGASLEQRTKRMALTQRKAYTPHYAGVVLIIQCALRERNTSRVKIV